MKKLTVRFAVICSLFIVLCSLSCDLYTYGKLGGADQFGTCYARGCDPEDPDAADDPRFLERMEFFSRGGGVWYSHYAGIGRLDGYRIGKFGEIGQWAKDSRGRDIAASLFPAFNAGDPQVYGGGRMPGYDDYILLYDDTAYGQADDDRPPQASWGFAYMGVVRAVNIFDGNIKRGAIIIEYLKGCAPAWLERWDESKGGKLPYFGIYCRVLDPVDGHDVVQMANAVNLAALYNGDAYYTEKATLAEAVEANGIENEAEFISWGVVIPQDREKLQ